MLALAWTFNPVIRATALGVFAAFLGGCSDIPNQIPANMTGTLTPGPSSEAREVYGDLEKLGRAYGLNVSGAPPNPTGRPWRPTDREWHIVFHCGKGPGDSTAFDAITARKGDLVLFLAFAYPFEKPENFSAFKQDLFVVLSRHGPLSSLRDEKPITQSDLQARAEHMGVDYSVRCGRAPPTRQETKAPK
jgi:hypothetical protein